MTYSSTSSKSTRPMGRVLWEELLLVEFLSPDSFKEIFLSIKL